MPNTDVQIINPIDYNNWNELIIRLNDYSFFHTSYWAETLVKTYHYKPVYFTLSNKNSLQGVVACMEIKSKLTGKRLVSLPFSDFCEPILNSIEESESVKEFIFNYCETNGLNYIEFRTSETKFPFETEQFRTDLRHILDITGDENILYKNFSENTKRNIKQAIKEGIILKEDNSLKGIKTFYYLQCLTRKKHGLPPQPNSFFKNIYKNILSVGKGTILFGYYQNRPVAALMFFTIGEKVLYKFGASLTDKFPKGTNHLLMWEAIKKYQKSGYKEFDFGRTETNHEGLRRFKTGFGADERIIYTTRYDIKNKKFISPDSKTTGIYNKIFRNAPLPLLKFIGNTVYKHMG